MAELMGALAEAQGSGQVSWETDGSVWSSGPGGKEKSLF